MSFIDEKIIVDDQCWWFCYRKRWSLMTFIYYRKTSLLTICFMKKYHRRWFCVEEHRWRFFFRYTFYVKTPLLMTWWPLMTFLYENVTFDDFSISYEIFSVRKKIITNVWSISLRFFWLVILSSLSYLMLSMFNGLLWTSTNLGLLCVVIPQKLLAGLSSHFSC